MLSTLLWLALAALIGFLLYAALQPSAFAITRSARIAASPQTVFDHVDDLHKWQAWSPWARLDPNAKGTFEGADRGVGSSFAWDGNKSVGSGKMTILESRPAEFVRMRLDFYKPMQVTNSAQFTFKPAGSDTDMTWTMTGNNSFMGRLMCAVMDMDKMVGGQFEQGLRNLNEIVGRR